uniref:Mitochondrial basic amino acids transporter n=1 Tax=Ciona savignyi TaxID=51511 RepID=H2YIT8_CIOSA
MVRFLIEYFSGCLGGIAGVFVGQPLDTIKVRLQTQGGKYRGVWHCFVSISQKESVYGLFKGMTSPIIGVSLINAIVFGVEAQTIKALGRETTFTHFVSGAFAGAVQSVVCAPMELAKTQMQVQGIGTRKAHDKVVYKGPLDVLRKTYQSNGIRGCYRGLVVTLIRETPAFGCYFATYDVLTSTVFVVNKNETYTSEGVGKMLLAGGFAGMASWASTYPADAIKSHIQADGAGGKPCKYNGMMDCAMKLYKAEGFSVFFRGLNSCLLRAFPVNAATFAVVHLSVQYLNNYFQ